MVMMMMVVMMVMMVVMVMMMVVLMVVMVMMVVIMIMMVGTVALCKVDSITVHTPQGDTYPRCTFPTLWLAPCVLLYH